MNKISTRTNRKISAYLYTTICVMLLISSCRKPDSPYHHDSSLQSSEVLDKWMSLQLRLMKSATGVPNQAFTRHYAYSGIAALESLAPGLAPGLNKFRKWQALTGLPMVNNSVQYYYPANVNAAMAAMNKSFFQNVKAEDLAAIDSLEAALNQEFLTKKPQDVITVSAAFGKAVATAVYEWAETDGYKNANNPYTPPVGPGLWKPTPPALASAATPYWGNNRTVISGSIQNTQPAAPIAYSQDPGSSFYLMVKQVHDASLNLTEDQKAMASFWRDVPGATTPGHWLNIVRQVMKKVGTRLDKAALTYALTGAAINDAAISVWKAKYNYNLVRPITYIREVMGYSTWNAFLGTPAHPEYVSAHSALSASVATTLQELYGNIGSFTDHTYDYLGYAPRTYSSFAKIAEEAGLSRFYAGIHYMPSITIGLTQGKKVANNIFNNNIPHY